MPRRELLYRSDSSVQEQTNKKQGLFVRLGKAWNILADVPEPPALLGLTFPDDKDTQEVKALDIMLDRAKVMEAEVFKDGAWVSTKASAGIVTITAIFGAMMTSRDTLFWRPESFNAVAYPLIFAEVILGLTAALFFYGSYKPLGLGVGPELEDEEWINSTLAGGEVKTKLEILNTIQFDIVDNRKKIGQGNARVSVGLFFLLLLFATTFYHCLESGRIKTEHERSLEELQHTLKLTELRRKVDGDENANVRNRGDQVHQGNQGQKASQHETPAGRRH